MAEIRHVLSAMSTRMESARASAIVTTQGACGRPRLGLVSAVLRVRLLTAGAQPHERELPALARIDVSEGCPVKGAPEIGVDQQHGTFVRSIGDAVPRHYSYIVRAVLVRAAPHPYAVN
jgi:hypothetical protein